MAEFKRSRIEKKSEDQITRQTVVMGILTIVVFLTVAIFGLPLLVRFSIFLGDAKNRNFKEEKEKVLPPLPPRLVVPFEATNSSRIAIKGFAEKNVMVELLKNDVSVGKMLANNAGEFAFGDILLDQGESSFTAIAISDVSGSSDPSKELKVFFKDVLPELLMISPSEDAVTVDNPDIDIAGKSEKGVSVTVNGRVAMVDDAGKFKIRYQLSSGKNNLEIIVTDIAGNVIKKNITITYDI